jgi:signal transduction histidine kinase
MPNTSSSTAARTAQPSGEPAYRSPPGAFGWLRHDPLLQGAFAICAFLIGFQLVVTLLQLPWIGPVTDWLRTVLAWLALLVVGYVAWWTTRARQTASSAWWLCTAALLTYAIAYTTWLVEYMFLYHYSVPFPTLSDFFFGLQHPFFFLAIIVIPRRRSATPRVVLTLDFLLWMGAALALSWFFMLAPIVTASGLSPLGKVVALSHPIGDLFVLLGLTLTLLRPPYSHPFAPVLGLLITAFACLVIADTWFTLIVLQPPNAYRTGAAPDLFWLSCYLLFPLAALLYLRITQRTRTVNGAAARREPDHDNPLWQDTKASLPHFLPIVGALLASAALTIGAVVQAAEPEGKDELWAITVIFSLLLLVIVRQAIMCLDDAHVHRERTVAQAREQALVELNRRKDEFLSIVGHELRTPLTSAQGYVQLMTSRLDVWQPAPDVVVVPATRVARAVAQARLMLADCAASLQRLTRLADDLIDDTRIRDDQLPLRMAPCDLRVLVREVVQAHRVLEPERVIYLRLGCAPSADDDTPLMVKADADRIVQVMTNYLSNALKYSRADRPVEVLVKTVGGRPHMARVSARDEGPGLTEAEQARVWERYPHIETVKVQYGSGVSLGLGLAISKSIIKRHGGEVGVESAPGQGSAFWFTLTLLAPPTASI